MDSLDVRILRSYYSDPGLSPIVSNFRTSAAALAKRLGQDEDTVRHRLERMLGTGFLSVARLMLNPRTWGGGHATVWFDVEPSAQKRDLVALLGLIPGMTHVAVFYDSLIACLDFDDETLLPGLVELVRRVGHAPEVFVALSAFPDVEIALTAHDWDLIRVLSADPRKPCGQVAAEVGTTSRTARTRLMRLIQEAVIFEWPSPNFRAVQGLVPVCLQLRYPLNRKAEVDEAVAVRLEPYLWHTVHMLPYHSEDLWPCGYDLMLPNLSVMREVLDWARGLPGVVHARTYLYDEVVSFFDAYGERLDRRLRQMPTARGSARGEAIRGSSKALEGASAAASSAATSRRRLGARVGP